MKPAVLKRALWAPVGIGIALTTIYLSVLWFNNTTTQPLDTGVTGKGEDIPTPTAPKSDQETKVAEEEKKEKSEEQEEQKADEKKVEEKPKEEEKSDESSKEQEKEEESSNKEKTPSESSVKNSSDSSQTDDATIAASLGNLPLEEYIKKQVAEIISYKEDWINNSETLINAWRINTKITSLIQALEEYSKTAKKD